jgi:hypothetical protein
MLFSTPLANIVRLRLRDLTRFSRKRTDEETPLVCSHLDYRPNAPKKRAPKKGESGFDPAFISAGNSQLKSRPRTREDHGGADDLFLEDEQARPTGAKVCAAALLRCSSYLTYFSKFDASRSLRRR